MLQVTERNVTQYSHVHFFIPTSVVLHNNVMYSVTKHLHMRFRRHQEFFMFPFQNEVTGNSYPSGTNLSLPITSGNVTSLLNKYPYVYRYRSQLPADFNRYFEVMTS